MIRVSITEGQLPISVILDRDAMAQHYSSGTFDYKQNMLQYLPGARRA